jgi:hypothetical protein
MKKILQDYIRQIDECKNNNELKSIYCKACKKLHPDLNNIDRCYIQDLNNAYQKRNKIISSLNLKDDIVLNTDIDISVFDELFKYQSQYKIDIELVGTWVWLTLKYPRKNTSEFKAFTIFKDTILKEKFGFVWSKSNKKWYLPSTPLKKRYCKTLSMEEKYIRYGRITVSNTKKQIS